jgi:hypothetical protein
LDPRRRQSEAVRVKNRSETGRQGSTAGHFIYVNIILDGNIGLCIGALMTFEVAIYVPAKVKFAYLIYK